MLTLVLLFLMFLSDFSLLTNATNFSLGENFANIKLESGSDLPILFPCLVLKS